MTRTLARLIHQGATLWVTLAVTSFILLTVNPLALFDENDEFVAYKSDNEYADIRYVFVEGIKAGQNTVSVETDEGPILLSPDPLCESNQRTTSIIVTPYSK